MTSRIVPRLGAWLVVAILLTFPLLAHSTTALIGDPRVDVWNHAWGQDRVMRHSQNGCYPG